MFGGKETMKNKEQIKYTYLHRRAFMDVVQTLILSSEEKTALLQKAVIHDLDKMAMYLFHSVKDTHTFHRANVSHHTGGFKKKYAGETTVTPEMRLDLLEMVVDWECARYTKPDKPLNAYETLYAFYPELESYILPILKELGWDSETKVEIPFLQDKCDARAKYIGEDLILEDLQEGLKYLFR